MIRRDLYRYVLVGLLIWQSPLPLFAIQPRIVVLGEVRLGNFRLCDLEVDREGALFFGSFDEIVKLRPDGKQVFQLRAQDCALMTIVDFRLTPGGDLLIAGVATEIDALTPKTRVVVVSPHGHIRTSFDVQQLLPEVVEAGDRGEILLAGRRHTEDRRRLSRYLTIARFGAGGNLISSFDVEEEYKMVKVRTNRPLMVMDREIIFTRETSKGIGIRRFSLDGQKLKEEVHAVESPVASADDLDALAGKLGTRVDFMAPFGSDSLIIALGVRSNRWERKMIEGGTGRGVLVYQPFWYSLSLVSLRKGRSHPITVPEEIGALRAVGHDGFLYFVRNQHDADGRIHTIVTKAALR